MSNPQFVDLSAYQPLNIDWQAYKKWSASVDGVSRVALRSSYGTGHTDEHFKQNRANALAAGIDQLIIYHFAYADLNKPEDEADYQMSVVGLLRPQDMLILDFEQEVTAASPAWAYAWLSRQEQNYGGKLPGIYAATSYIGRKLQDSRLAKYPLWLAQWTFDSNVRPSCPSPWKSYFALQYTDEATNIPGIAGRVDASVFISNPIGEEAMIIQLSQVSKYYRLAPGNAWQCTVDGHDFIIGHAILSFYQAYGGNALCGLTYLGLPISNEQGLPGGGTYQRFERGVLCYDPNHAYDNPPGAGSVYVAHIDQGIGQDPRITPLQGQVSTLTQQNATLQSQLATAQSGDTTALQSQLTQAETLRDQYLDGLRKIGVIVVDATSVPSNA